jgi:hypothetical protein
MLVKFDRKTFLRVMEEFPDIMNDAEQVAIEREKMRLMMEK